MKVEPSGILRTMTATKLYFALTNSEFKPTEDNIKQYAVGDTIDNVAQEINFLEDDSVEVIFNAKVPDMECRRILDKITVNLPLAFLRRETAEG